MVTVSGEARRAATVNDGNLSEGIEDALDGLGTLKGSGDTAFHAFLSIDMARVLLNAGRASEGLTVLEEGSAACSAQGLRFYEAEMHRLKGVLLLMGPPEAEAEQLFRDALAIARRQEAKSWELRAATSPARLLHKQGRIAEARDALAPVYNWFTEGFDTGDLKDAKALLEELEAKP